MLSSSYFYLLRLRIRERAAVLELHHGLVPS